MGYLLYSVLSLCGVLALAVVGYDFIGNAGLGCKALLRVWSDPLFSTQVRRWLGGQETLTTETAVPAPAPAPAPTPVAPAPAAPRHDALSLLAVLQREARLIDFLQEPIDGFTDAQIGAAARSVHKDSAAVIARMFGVESLNPASEGATVEIPAGYDPAQYRLVGNVPAQGPWRGRLAHPGWKATRCDVPDWTGKAEATRVLAPTEVEF